MLQDEDTRPFGIGWVVFDHNRSSQTRENLVEQDTICR